MRHVRTGQTSGDGCFRPTGFKRSASVTALSQQVFQPCRWIRHTQMSTVILVRNLSLNRYYPGIVWSRELGISKDSTCRPVCSQFGESVQTRRCPNHVRPANILGFHPHLEAPLSQNTRPSRSQSLAHNLLPPPPHRSFGYTPDFMAFVVRSRPHPHRHCDSIFPSRSSLSRTGFINVSFPQ